MADETLETKVLAGVFCLSYIFCVVSLGLDGRLDNHEAPIVNYSAAVVMVFFALGAMRKPRRFIARFKLQDTITPAAARMTNTLGPFITGVGVAVLSQRNPSKPIWLYGALCSAYSCACCVIIHARPLTSDYGVLNAIFGLLVGYTFNKFGITVLTCLNFAVCYGILVLRGYLEKKAVEAMQQA